MRKLMVLAAMLAMMMVAAAPAFAQTQTATGGSGTVSGGSIVAKNSIVAQSQNLFNVSGNIVQQSLQQNQTANQTASASVVGTGNASATNIAVQSSNQTGIRIGNVMQSSSIAIANAR